MENIQEAIEKVFVKTPVPWDAVEGKLRSRAWQAFEFDLNSGTVVAIMQRVDGRIRFVHVGRLVATADGEPLSIASCTDEQKQEVLKRANWNAFKPIDPYQCAREKIGGGLGDVRRAFNTNDGRDREAIKRKIIERLRALNQPAKR